MKKIAALIFIFTLTALHYSCKKDPISSGQGGAFGEVVARGGGFEDPTTSEETLSSNSEPMEINGEQWLCKTETKSFQRGGGGLSGFPSFNPNASVIYPGNLLQGNSLHLASPKIIAVERAGGTISTDVADGNIQSSFTVEEISKSSVGQAVNNIIEGSTGVVPANFEFSYSNVQSREQFAMELGVDVETAFVELESNLQFSSDNSLNRFIVQLNQSYYTMSYDIPTSLDQVFAPNVTPDDLAKYTGDGNPAAYISDVTYGRVYYMLFESTSSVTDMDLAISGAYNGIGAKVEGDLEIDYLKELDNLKIKVFAFGGESTSTIQTISKVNLDDLVDLLAESTDIRTAKPLSYVVRSVYDNQIVSVQLATQYDVVTCEPVSSTVAPPYTAHWEGEVVKAMGGVGAAYCPNGTEFILISRDGQQFMRSNTGTLEGPFSINELGNGPCKLQGGIGAACNLDGNQWSSKTIMCFDKAGVNYTYLFNDGDWSGNDPNPIGNLANGNTPFNITGVGAIAFRDKDSNGPSQRFMFNNPGNRYSLYTNNPNSFGNVYDTWQWGPDNTCPFPKIGAAIGFGIGNDVFYILFNELGTKYTVYGNVDGSGSDKFLGSFNL